MKSREGLQSNNQIRRYRKRRGYTLKNLAKIMGVLNQGQINQWENERKTPTLDNALKLSATLDCPLEILYLERFNAIRKELYPRKVKILQKSHNSEID